MPVLPLGAREEPHGIAQGGKGEEKVPAFLEAA